LTCLALWADANYSAAEIATLLGTSSDES